MSELTCGPSRLGTAQSVPSLMRSEVQTGNKVVTKLFEDSEQVTQEFAHGECLVLAGARPQLASQLHLYTPVFLLQSLTAVGP